MCDGLNEIFQLLVAGPQLSFMHAVDALAKQAEGRVGKAEQASNASAEGVGNGIAIRVLEQQNLGNPRMSKMQTAHHAHFMFCVHQDHIGRTISNRGQYGGIGQLTGADSEFGTAAQGRRQKLTMHMIGVRDKDTDSFRSG